MSVYEIRVKGRLDQRWAAWFEGLTLTHEGDSTVLRGPLADEAALHGVLTKVGNINLHLLSVNIVEASDAVSESTRVSDRDLIATDATGKNALTYNQPSAPTEAKPQKHRRRKRLS